MSLPEQHSLSDRERTRSTWRSFLSRSRTSASRLVMRLSTSSQGASSECVRLSNSRMSSMLNPVALGRANESQPLQSGRIVLPVVAVAARGGSQQAGALIKTQRGSRGGSGLGELADGIGGHEIFYAAASGRFYRRRSAAKRIPELRQVAFGH